MSSARKKTHPIFHGQYIVRRDGQWSDKTRGRFRINPVLCGDDRSRAAEIEAAAAATHKVGVHDVICVVFRSKDDVYSWSIDSKALAERTKPVTEKDETPIPKGEWIQEFGEDDIKDAVIRFGLNPEDFDERFSLEQKRQRLAMVLHQKNPDEPDDESGE